MLCPACGAVQQGCACSPAAIVLGQVKRAQDAVRAAAESDAHLLQFLREFGADAARAVSFPPVARLPKRGGRSASGDGGRDIWDPPLASERYERVPFKPLAIVPLPVAPPALAAAAGAPLPAPAHRLGAHELLPAKRSSRSRQRRWKGRA